MKYLRNGFFIMIAVLLLAILGAYILLIRTDPEKYSVDDTVRSSATGKFINVKDGVTHYEIAGPDTGRLVVLIHGFSVPYYIWDSNFSVLVRQGFRVLRYDEFGRGFSDRPEKIYDAAFLRRQLFDLLDRLNIHEVFAIAGISFGGIVATDFATHYPQLVKKIILIDPVFPVINRGSHSEYIASYLMALAPDDMIKGQLTDLKYPRKFPAWGDQYKIQMQYRGFRNALVSTRFHYGAPGIICDNYVALNKLGKPVLLVWGREDKTVDFHLSDSLRKIIHPEFFPVADAGHLPQMEKSQEVNMRMISFLNEK